MALEKATTTGKSLDTTANGEANKIVIGQSLATTKGRTGGEDRKDRGKKIGGNGIG
jgi:hypothetical protein